MLACVPRMEPLGTQRSHRPTVGGVCASSRGRGGAWRRHWRYRTVVRCARGEATSGAEPPYVTLDHECMHRGLSVHLVWQTSVGRRLHARESLRECLELLSPESGLKQSLQSCQHNGLPRAREGAVGSPAGRPWSPQSGPRMVATSPRSKVGRILLALCNQPQMVHSRNGLVQARSKAHNTCECRP